MKSQRLVGLLAGTIVVASVLAQVAPTCCKYLYSWPPSENPTTLCTTGYGKVCEDYGTYPALNDPLARKREGWRNAKCWEYTIANGSSFAQGPCSGGPPPGGVLVGVLPNGLCCYYVQGTGPEPEPTDRGYLIWNCEKECASNPT